jgi:hypothetical protein
LNALGGAKRDISLLPFCAATLPRGLRYSCAEAAPGSRKMDAAQYTP